MKLLKVEQLKNGEKVVRNHAIAKQGNIISLQSYDSLVAIYDTDNNNLTLGRDWDYSATTMRALNIFLRDYTVTGLQGKSAINRAIDQGSIEYDITLF